jgi:hypothetical protein
MLSVGLLGGSDGEEGTETTTVDSLEKWLVIG